MNRTRLYACTIALLCALPVSTLAQTKLLSRFDVKPIAFRDSTVITYTLADTALSLSLVVFAADSVTPVDTLRAPAAENSTSQRRYAWKRTRSAGGLAGDGVYVLTMRATGKSRPDTTLSRTLFVDTTLPILTMLGVDPAIYAPGVIGQPPVLSVWFSVSNVSPVYPGRTPDRLGVRIRTPTGAENDTASVKFEPPLSGTSMRSLVASGTYEMQWAPNAVTTTDGLYTVELTAVDVAAGSTTDAQVADIDTKRPDIHFIDPETNKTVSVVADSLYFYARDRSMVDSLLIRYSASAPLTNLTPIRTSGDTLFFRVPLADSVRVTGESGILIRAVDRVSRVNATLFEVTWDTTAAAAPVLDSASARWRHRVFRLNGHFGSGAELGSRIFVYRNGTPVDTLIVGINSTFASDVALLAGSNALTATHVDPAGNESAPSNTVTIVLDDGAGLFIPSPMSPGRAFQVNTTRDAESVEVRLYDMGGDLVHMLSARGPSRLFALTWDGKNAHGIEVRRGPLTIVATIRYADGESQRIRDVFLYTAGEK